MTVTNSPSPPSSPLPPSVSAAAELNKPQSMWNRGFIALLITQFLVALNDNLFRWFIIPIGASCVGWGGPANRGFIVSLGGLVFMAPFILLASTAGYCCDRFSRRTVMIWSKAIEIVAIALGIWAVVAQSVPGMLIVLCLLGAQSAFFSPCKYGSILDLVPHHKLTSANGIVSMTTMIAAVAGMVLGGYIADITTELDVNGVAVEGTGGTVNPWIWISMLMGVAVVGFLSSLFISRLPAVDPKTRFPFNPFAQTAKDIRTLFRIRPVFIAGIASAFFWGLALIAQMNIDKFGVDTLKTSQTHTMFLSAILSFGIGGGSVLAGLWSKRRIELGLVPVGAFGIGLCMLLLAFTPVSTVLGRSADIHSFGFLYALAVMTTLGVFAGLYDIPLAAYIQDRSPKEIRGRVIAAVNFFSNSMMLLFSGVFMLLVSVLGLTANKIWLVLTLVVLFVAVGTAIHFLPQLIRVLANVILTVVYRRQMVGLENIPEDGPVLFVGNHVTYIDGFMLYTAVPREPRFIAHADYLPKPIISYLADRARIIRILPGKHVVRSIREGRKALDDGESLVIFPEGGMTRTGALRYFEPGYQAFLKGREDIPIVPFYIGGLFGSMFSYAHDGKSCLWPQKLRDSVVMAFGKPIRGPVNDPQRLQQIVEELGVETMKRYNRKPLPIPIRLGIRRCRKKGRKMLMADSLGIKLSGYKFLTAAIVARHLLRQHVLGPDDRNVGTLVPMSVGGMVANAALALDGRTVVNLNMTFGADTLNYCIKKADIIHVLTSRRILERYPDLKLDARVVCMEDLLPKAPRLQRLLTYLRVILTPSWILERQLGLHRVKREENLALIFTSGSTGMPKGVELTHENIGECARGFFDTVGVKPDDVMLGVLPFFHAFGYVGNFWMILLAGCTGILHYNPLEAKTVGALARQYGCNFIPCTPTFLRGYLRRPKEDFEGFDTILAGAEKMPIDLIDAWEAKFGSRPAEGYGTTELSPCAAVNLPVARQRGSYQPYLRDGSIGPPLPNIAMKVVDLDTGDDLPPNEIGMIIVKGPIVMKGYYKDPEQTAKVIKDGWYWTGDVGRRDPEGFVFITGRQSRISKIGGEMVPHILIEEKIQQIIHDALHSRNEARGGEKTDETALDDNAVLVAVTAVPDAVKGERIVVLHRELPVTPTEIRAAMLAEEFPNLWIPSPNAFYRVDAIPLLGTGKLDLRRIKETALELTASPHEP